MLMKHGKIIILRYVKLILDIIVEKDRRIECMWTGGNRDCGMSQFDKSIKQTYSYNNTNVDLPALLLLFIFFYGTRVSHYNFPRQETNMM